MYAIRSYYAVTAVGVLSLMYIFPAKPNRGLRWIPVFKVFLIVSIWSTMAFIPFINSWPSLHHNILIFVTFWIYIFALTILFDIQDMNTDAYHLSVITSYSIHYTKLYDLSPTFCSKSSHILQASGNGHASSLNPHVSI